MGSRFPGVGSTAIVTVNPATTAETAICTTPQLLLSYDSQQVLLWWFVEFVTGSATTAVTMRIHRSNGLGAPVINIPSQWAIGANATFSFSGCYSDTPAGLNTPQYTLSFQQINATGNATIQDVCLIAMAL